MSRSVKKGPFVDARLLGRIDDMNKRSERKVLKTWSRASVIFPQMIGHTIALVACTLILVPVADLGLIYTVTAVVLGAIFIGATVWLGRHPTAAASMRVFGYSITYVTLLFGAMTLDVLV